jgi:hypothetical protein
LYQRARIDKRQMPILRRSNVQGYR